MRTGDNNLRTITEKHGRDVSLSSSRRNFYMDFYDFLNQLDPKNIAAHQSTQISIYSLSFSVFYAKRKYWRGGIFPRPLTTRRFVGDPSRDPHVFSGNMGPPQSKGFFRSTLATGPSRFLPKLVISFAWSANVRPHLPTLIRAAKKCHL